LNLRNPLVSVIIPNYNYANYLYACIQSVLNQDYTNLEVIVIDDGSTDTSVEIIQTFNSSVTLLAQKNSGVSAARNAGIKIARGDSISFLDADDTLAPTKISKQIQLIQKLNYGMVYCGVNICDERLKKVETVSPKYRGDCSLLFYKYPSRSIVILGSGTPLISRSLIKLVGGFNVSLRTSSDLDFMRRICNQTKIDFVNEPLVNYRRHEMSMSVSSLQGYYRDNLIAIKLMVADTQSLKNSRVKWAFNFLAWSLFNLRASSALLREKHYKEAFSYLINLFKLKI